MYTLIQTHCFFPCLQVHVIRSSNDSCVSRHPQHLLYADGRVADMGRRTLQGSRAQRYSSVHRPLGVRSPVPFPLEGTRHEDARDNTGGGRVGDSSVGYHCSYNGKEESVYYSLSKLVKNSFCCSTDEFSYCIIYNESFIKTAFSFLCFVQSFLA